MRLILAITALRHLAPASGVTLRRGSATVKASKSQKKGLAATSSKNKKRAAPVATRASGSEHLEDVGIAHRYFAAAPEDSRFYFRALAIRGGGAEIPPADGLPGGPPRGGETAVGEAPEDILSYGGSHQDQLQGLLAVLATQEVQESMSDCEEIMSMQSRTGVIYATTRAKRWGFKGAGDPAWGNLGQGAPETGPIGGPERSLAVELDDETNEYGDVNGRRDLRDAVAQYYNHWFRQGKESQYTAANVAIVPGGRAGLSRLMASLHNVNVGYFLPDYTAYQQLLGEFTGVAPIAIAHDQDGLRTSPEHLRRQIQLHGLGAFLWSNPANPTGEPIEGDTLKQYVEIARQENTMMLMDEFYSHYMYEQDSSSGRPFHTLSSAEYVDDVNKDPICIVNGFTKNWRLPGWRCCWVVGPKHCIDVLGSIGSFMDGGTNNPLQKAAVPLLEPAFVEKDALALQAHFREKRDYMVRELEAMGIKARVPKSTFYIWADVSALPPPLNNCVVFFEYCVRHKVICVPGIFFDVNPFHRRRFHKSPYIDKLRMSYGPAWPNLKQAVKGMKEIIDLAKAGRLPPLGEPTD